MRKFVSKRGNLYRRGEREVKLFKHSMQEPLRQSMPLPHGGGRIPYPISLALDGHERLRYGAQAMDLIENPPAGMPSVLLMQTENNYWKRFIEDNNKASSVQYKVFLVDG